MPKIIIKTIQFDLPLPEMQAYRRAAKHRGIGVVRWLRNLAEADIAAIDRGGRDE
jgi:hypothetical protein